MTAKYHLKSMPSAQCHVEIERDSYNQLVSVSLVSYKSEALRIHFDVTGKLVVEPIECAVDYSSTTARHVNRFTTEFFGKNLYFELKSFDFLNPEPLNVEAYYQVFMNAVIDYEMNGKRWRG